MNLVQKASIAASFAGKAVEIGFNATFLADILGQIQGESVIVEIQDSASPVRITDPADARALFVLMPLRV